MGTGRLLRQKIMLPITDTGSPDYEFMDDDDYDDFDN